MSKIQEIMEILKKRKDWESPEEVNEFFEKSLNEIYQEGVRDESIRIQNEIENLKQKYDEDHTKNVETILKKFLK